MTKCHAPDGLCRIAPGLLEANELVGTCESLEPTGSSRPHSQSGAYGGSWSASGPQSVHTLARDLLGRSTCFHKNTTHPEKHKAQQKANRQSQHKRYAALRLDYTGSCRFNSEQDHNKELGT